MLVSYFRVWGAVSRLIQRVGGMLVERLVELDRRLRGDLLRLGDIWNISARRGKTPQSLVYSFIYFTLSFENE